MGRKKKKNWDEVPLNEFPDCYEGTFEERNFVRQNKDLKDYILSLKFEERKDYKALNIKEKCKFIGKYYDPKGDPHAALVGSGYYFYEHLKNTGLVKKSSNF